MAERNPLVSASSRKNYVGKGLALLIFLSGRGKKLAQRFPPSICLIYSLSFSKPLLSIRNKELQKGAKILKDLSKVWLRHGCCFEPLSKAASKV
jgi:hypothetical protein